MTLDPTTPTRANDSNNSYALQLTPAALELIDVSQSQPTDQLPSGPSEPLGGRDWANNTVWWVQTLIGLKEEPQGKCDWMRKLWVEYHCVNIDNVLQHIAEVCDSRERPGPTDCVVKQILWDYENPTPTPSQPGTPSIFITLKDDFELESAAPTMSQADTCPADICPAVSAKLENKCCARVGLFESEAPTMSQSDTIPADICPFAVPTRDTH